MDDGRRVFLARHGETEWSAAGKHTGRTDVPLTTEGKRRAKELGALLRGRGFDLVLSSPLSRALDTCRIAGFGDCAEVDDRMVEWDYGVFEGRSTEEIRSSEPGWSVWTSEIREGESVHEVGRRADDVIDRARDASGDVLLFAHGHYLRILTARWLGLAPACGRLFRLDTATLSVLGYERESPVILKWNLSLPSGGPGPP